MTGIYGRCGHGFDCACGAPLDEPTSDYDDVMGAVQDGFIDAASVHCIHGTFIGTPGGPDYLCGYCESGITVEELDYWRELDARRTRRIVALAPRMRALLDEAVAMDGDNYHEPTVAALGRRLARLVRWGVVPASPELERPAATILQGLAANQAQADAYADALGDPSLYR